MLLLGADITPGTPVTIAVDRPGQAALIDGTRPREATIHDGVDRQAAGQQRVRQGRAAVVGERTNERGEHGVRGDRPQTERGILRRDERHLIQRAGGIDADNRIDWIEQAGRERSGVAVHETVESGRRLPATIVWSVCTILPALAMPPGMPTFPAIVVRVISVIPERPPPGAAVPKMSSPPPPADATLPLIVLLKIVR